MEVIRAEQIGKTFDNGLVQTEVIRNLDLSIQEGEFVMISGPSGSGKSTLLYLLSGLEPLTQGEVQIKGKPISNLSDKDMSAMRRNEIGFVYQFFNLLDEMDVGDNVMLPALIGKEKLDTDKLDRVLSLVGLQGKEKSYPYELSGGQQQRVAIARAVYADPSILFADEPTGNLDSENSETIMELFYKINRELSTTIVMVTHSEELMQKGTRQVHLRDGIIC